MRVFSLDPGANKIGYSIYIDGSLEDFGLVEKYYEGKFNSQLNQRLIYLTPLFEDYLDKYSITHVAWEMVPNTRMGQRDHVLASSMSLKVCTFQRELNWLELTANKWHKLLLGRAKGVSKFDVKEYLCSLDQSLAIDMPADVYDAIGIGLIASRIDAEEWQSAKSRLR